MEPRGTTAPESADGNPDPTITRRLRAEADFQNQRVALRGENRDKFYFLAERARKRYEACLEDVAGKRVLIVGCNQGGVTPLARKGATVVGIDIADEAIRRLEAAVAREGLQDRAEVRVMDAENVQFPPDSFDLICCTGVLHHLDVENASRSWARVLKPSGTVVMLEPLAWNPAAAVYRWFTPESRTPFEHPLKPRDIRLLRKHFRGVELEGFALTSPASAPLALVPGLSAARRRTVALLESLDDFLIKRIPPLLYLSWTVLIECTQPRRSDGERAESSGPQ